MAIPQDKWPDMHIILHPSVRLVEIRADIPELWSYFEQAKKGRKPSAKKSQMTTWVVWRREIQSYYSPCTQEEAAMMRALMAHQPFADVCQEITAWLPDDQAANYAINTLSRWLRDGLLSTCTI